VKHDSVSNFLPLRECPLPSLPNCCCSDRQAHAMTITHR
jgi:hypothetical protein